MRLASLLIGIALAPLAFAESAPLKPDATADATLDALHARGQGLKDFSGPVSMTTTDLRTGNVTAQSGKVVFQERDGNGRIRVSFDRRQVQGGIEQSYKQDYVLQDGWLTDRDYHKKQEVRRQVLRPGQKTNLLKLGEGPFPLPIGQPKDDVKKMFEVTKVETTADDPKNTIHLKLIPRAGADQLKQFKQIDVFIDRNTIMPVRIDTMEKAGNLRTTELPALKINAGVTDKDFDLPNIEGQGWTRREEPYDQR